MMAGAEAARVGDEEARSYGLEWLATHLAGARRLDRLRLLFSTDRWLRQRVTADNYFYDGYLSDLSLAIDAMVTSSGEAAANTIPDAARLGWLRATGQSRTAAPDRILVSIARHAAWPPARLAAYIQRIPGASKRLRTFARVLRFGTYETEGRNILEKAAREDAAFSGKQTASLQALTALAGAASPATRDAIARLMTALVEQFEPTDAIPRRAEDEPEQDGKTFTIDDAIEAVPFLADDSRDALVSRLLTLVAGLAQTGEEKADDDSPEQTGRDSSDQILALLGDPAPEVRAELLKARPATGRTLMEDLHDAFWKRGRDVLGPALRGRQLYALAPYVAAHPQAGALAEPICKVIETTHDGGLIHTLIAGYAPLLNIEQAQRVLTRVAGLAQADFERCRPAFLAGIPPSVSAALGATEALDAARKLAGTQPDAEPADGVDDGDPFHAGLWRQFMGRAGVDGPFTAPEIDWAASLRDDPEGLAFQLSSPAEARLRWARRALHRNLGKTVAGGESHAATPPAATPPAGGETGGRDLVVEYLTRVGAPLFLSRMLPGVAGTLSTEELDKFIDLWLTSHFDDDEYAFQFYLLSTMGTAEDGADAELHESIRRVQGWFLRNLIRRAAEGQEPIAAAWDGLPRAAIASADMSPVLDYVLTLPHFVERNMFVYAMYGDGDSLQPMLQALQLLAPLLRGPELDRAFRHIIELNDPEARRMSLDILGPYLSREELQRVLLDSKLLHGFRIPSSTLAALDTHNMARTPALEQWIDRTAAMATNGSDIAQNLLLGLRRAGGSADGNAVADRCEQLLRNRDANIRLDCLHALLTNWPQDIPIPDRLLDLAMDLPVVNQTQRFSWRGYLLPVLARVPDTAIERIWNACQDLPRRLHIGDSQAWGWHWTYEYPYAGAVNSLAARAPEALLPVFFKEAEGFFWAAREDILERLAARAGPALATEIFHSVVRRLQEYRTEGAEQDRLFATEGAVSVLDPKIFLVAREQAASNIIAALAPRLADEEFHQALELCLNFTDDGPRSWLPAQLLKIERPANHDLVVKVLRRANLASLLYVIDDPSRVDMLIDLLPMVRREAAAATAPLRDLVSQHYPGKPSFLLNRDELARLPDEVQAEYWRLFNMEDQLREVAPNLDLRELAQNPRAALTGLTEDQGRAILEVLHLGPLVGSHLEEAIENALFHNPPSKRAGALSLLRENMPGEGFRRIVTRHFQEVRELLRGGDSKGLELLAAMARFLPSELHPEYVAAVLEADAVRGPTAEEQELFLRSLLKQYSREGEPSGTRQPRGGAELLMDRQFLMKERDKTYAALRGVRGVALLALEAHVEPAFRPELLGAALRLPANEQCVLLEALIEKSDESERRAIFEAVARADSPIVRIFVPWTAREHVPEDMKKSLAAAMAAAAEELRAWESRVAGLLIAAGEADERHTIHKRCEEILSKAGEGEALLGASILLLRMTERDPEIREACIQRLLHLQDPELRLKAMVAMGRLSDERNADIRKREDVATTGVRLVLDAANSGRDPYVRHLLNLAAVLGFQDDPARWEGLAPFLMEVDEQWTWL